MSVKLTKEQLINRLNEIDNSYDYSLINYIDMHKKVIVKCLKHDIFTQTPINLLNGFLCKECKKEKLNKQKLKNILIKSNKIHNNKYDYSCVKFTKMIIPVDIKCPIHGIFPQSLNNHVNQRKGCPKCTKNYKLDRKTFIDKCNIIHDNKYNYSFVNFKNVATIVNIKCPIHDIFPQTPNNHLSGVGCPFCIKYKGEEKISKILKDNNIKFIRQKTFNDCKNIKKLYFDFYLPDYNICIEYDGKQHYESVEYFGGIKEFKNIQKRDRIKNEYCSKNNIILIRISYNDNINEIINNLIFKLSK